MEDKPVKYLIERFRAKGLIGAKTNGGARQVLHYWIRNGRLKLRQRPFTDWYVVNNDEVEEILEEFSPGGSGKWSYQDRPTSSSKNTYL